MSKSCPVPTPEERRYGEIQGRIETDLKRKVFAALREAAAQAQAEIRDAGSDLPAPAYEYFVSTMHQALYCTLCGADPETLLGGRASTALLLIKNSQNIARHYWGAEIDPAPRS